MTDPALAAHLDQLDAATDTARRWFAGLDATGPTATAGPTEVIAAKVADLMTDATCCQHLAAAPWQAAVLRLDGEPRADCPTCAAQPYPPPPEPWPCAWCGRTDDELITLAVSFGALVAVGLTCSACSAALDEG